MQLKNTVTIKPPLDDGDLYQVEAQLNNKEVTLGDISS